MARLLDRQDNFKDGIDYNEGAGALCQQLTNFRILPNGAIEKRGGSQYIGNSNNPFSGGVVTAGFDFASPSNGNVVTHLVVTDSGTGWYRFREGTDVTWQNTASAILGQGSFAQFSQTTAATEAVYYADTGPLNRYTFGGGLTINIAGTPNVSHICVYNRRLFGTGDTANPQRVYWSALDDGDSLGNAGAGGGFVDVITASRSQVVGLAVAGASLLIFHRDGISRFTGWTQDDFAVDPRGVSSSIGCKQRRSITQLGSTQVAFLGNDGIYISDGSGVVKVSDAIQGFLTRQLLVSQPFVCVLGHNPRYHELWIAISGEDTNGIFSYDLDRQAWAGPHAVTGSGFRPSALWAGYDNLQRQYLTFGNESIDAPVRMDALDVSGDPFFLDHVEYDETGGSALTAQAKFKRFDFGSPAVTKSLRAVRIAADFKANTGVTVVTATPVATGATTSFTTVNGDRPYVAFPGGVGPWVDVTLTDAGSAGLSVVQAVEVEAFSSLRHGL